MSLRIKFNLMLALAFLSALAVTGVVAYRLLHENARAEVLRNGELMMESSLAIRRYTVQQVVPNFELQLQRVFLPQSVPAFAATETLNQVRKQFPDYSYKEAVLNPTNPRDRAADWEADLINEFRNRDGTAELSGERDTPTGPLLYIARPIKINDAACLTCHSTPAAAPAIMIKMYGEANGFGWKLGETVGAQVVTVPMSVPIENARRLFAAFMVALTGVFALFFVVLNVMLTRVVIAPVTQLANVADRVSMGEREVPEFTHRGNDEVSALTASFNRMRRSLEKAMKLIDGGH